MSESPFSKIPSQLDNIPKDVPVVFISYSWDSQEHKDWVLQLSKDLREKFRVYTLLDQYNRGGEDIVSFMQNGLKRADRVLIIGTPKYKEKIERNNGGAKFEDQVISIQLYHDMGSNKFVPILREGTFDNSFGNLIETRIGFDMHNDANYEEELQKLAADLWGCPMNIAPTLGPKPNFTPAAQVLQPLKASSPADFSTIVKTYLLDPSKRILLTEILEDERDVAFNKIMEHASYDHQITVQLFNDYMLIHQDAIANLMSAMLPVVRYGTLNQQKLLVDAMVKLCTKPFRNGERGIVGTEYVHLLASTFLYHATGMAAVKFGRFDLILEMMTTMVPAPNALSIAHSFSLESMSGCNHWNYDSLNAYLQAQWLYPYSQMVMSSIKTYFGKTFIDDNDFVNCYYTWEHLASLACHYYKCNDLSEKWFPLGGFLNKRTSLLGHEYDFYTNFFLQAEQLKDEWEPLKQGMFGGKYSEYKKVYDEAEAFYNNNRRYLY